MNSLLDLIRNSNEIAVISHINPDGDSIGSIMGLGLALKQIHQNVKIFICDDIPKKYQFIPGIDIVKQYKPEEPIDFDLCFVLDCAEKARLGNSEKILEKSKKVINVDHHVSNNFYGDINIVDTEASSTSEIVYSLIKENLQLRIDASIATCLYIGIVTDTGRFIYDNTSAYTHKIVAELLDLGINLQEIVVHIYQTKSENSVRLLGHILSNMDIIYNGKVAMLFITSDLLKQFSVHHSEIDGMIDYARDIEGVEVAIMLKNLDSNRVRVSFRSKNNVDVNKLAREFNGGGHRKASGATVEGSLEQVKKQVEEKLQNYI